MIKRLPHHRCRPSRRNFCRSHLGACALDAAQETELKAALKGVTGKDVAIAVTVDPSILGGLIVKVGSRQIDTSLRTKLSTLKLALKEVG